MGDDGWLKKSHVEFRKFVYFSDVVRLEGKVVKKYIDENGEPCVDIETTAINQRNEEVMPGSGTVILPSREKGTFPLGKRLPVKKIINVFQ
jgi:acyl dehydratase